MAGDTQQLRRVQPILEPNYTVLEYLGQGQLGPAFRALENDLERTVVLKIVRREDAQSSQVWNYFLSRARILARLRHHRIAQLYGVSRNPAADYAVFEDIRGVSLARWLARNGPVLPAAAAQAALDAIEGLSAAHAEGLLHLNIKPSNVFFDYDQRLLLTDFAIVNLSTPAENPYLPPRSDGHQLLSEMTDLFATGTLLETMLTGRPIIEFAADIVIPNALADIILRARRLDDKGYPTLDSMKDDLLTFLASLSTATTSESASVKMPASAKELPVANQGFDFRQLHSIPIKIGADVLEGARVDLKHPDLEPTDRSSRTNRFPIQLGQIPEPRRIEIQFGPGLEIENEVDRQDLWRECHIIRRRQSEQLGLRLPDTTWRVIDSLPARTMVVELTHVGSYRKRIPPDHVLCSAPQSWLRMQRIPNTADPLGLPGSPLHWISEVFAGRAREAGFRSLPFPYLLPSIIPGIYQHHSWQFLDLPEAKRSLSEFSKQRDQEVSQIVPGRIGWIVYCDVLRHLLRERVPAANLPVILGAIDRAAARSGSAVYLAEMVRRALRWTVIAPFLMDDVLPCFELSSVVEELIRSASSTVKDEIKIDFEPRLRTRIADSFAAALTGHPHSLPVYLVANDIRPFVAGLTVTDIPEAAVISRAEVPPAIRVVPLAKVELLGG